MCGQPGGGQSHMKLLYWAERAFDDEIFFIIIFLY